MKTLLSILGIIIFTAVLTSCGGSETSNTEETPNTEAVKIGDLEVMSEDLGKMNWYDAKSACEDLGDGWRLPEINEFKILYKNKDKIGGFAVGKYWSSTEKSSGFAWKMNFASGLPGSRGKKSEKFFVRAIRFS